MGAFLSLSATYLAMLELRGRMVSLKDAKQLKKLGVELSPGAEVMGSTGDALKALAELVLVQ